MANKNDPPFLKSIKHLQELFDIDFKSAMDSIQSIYSNFKHRNQQLIERQNDQSNAAQIQVISHFASLATLTVTVLGLLLTLAGDNLTSNQQVLVLIIIILEIGSLFFGAADYLQTIRFHRNWALLYQSIDREVDEKSENGELQWTSDLNKIEAKHLQDTPETTKMWVTYLMIALCLIGLALVVLLFAATFYDVPLIK